MTTPRSAATTVRRECMLFILIAAIVLVWLVSPVFRNFFYGDDWNDYALYLRSHGNFLRAIFTPVPPFFRPVSYAWVIATQLLLPWTPGVHYALILFMTLVNAGLLLRIMQLVTRSSLARALGLGLFIVSKVHVTVVGVPLLLEMVVQLLQFLITLWGIIVYLQTGLRRYLIISVAAFTMCVFSRDASVLLLAVVVCALVMGLDGSRKIRPWTRFIPEAAPFVCVALLYVIVRFIAMGLPPVGGSGYAIGFNSIRMLRKLVEAVANIFNLSAPVNASNGIDLPMLAGPWADPVRGIVLIGIAGLLIWTGVRAFRAGQGALCIFVWSAAVLGPILVIGVSAVYYSYELVAATAVCVAIAADYRGQKDVLFRSAWLVVVLGVGVGAYWHNHNLDKLAWFYCGDLAKRANADLVESNRCSAIGRMVIVTPSVADAQRVAYILGPDGEPDQNAMLASLLAPQRFPLRVVTIDQACKTSAHHTRKEALDDMAADPADFIYVFDPAGFSFRRHTPFRVGECLESFEGDSSSIHPVWVENTKTTFAINRQASYISDGRQSLMVDTKANDAAVAHYAGIQLQATHSKGLALDISVVRPEMLRGIHVWEVDARGEPIFGWANMAPASTFRSGQRTRVELLRYSDSDTGFMWNRDLKRSEVPTGVFVILETKPSGETKVYLDHFCAAAR